MPGEIVAPPDEVLDPTGGDLCHVLCWDFLNEAPAMFPELFSLVRHILLLPYFCFSGRYGGCLSGRGGGQGCGRMGVAAGGRCRGRARVQSRQDCGPLSWLNQPSWQQRVC